MTKTQRAAMQQALEALEFFRGTAICDADTKVADEGITALRAALAEPEQVCDQSDFGTWFCRLGKLADAYHETGRTHPARFKARGELMAHALDAVIGWRARSALEQQQPARQPLTDEEIVDAVRDADLDWHAGWSLDDDALNRYVTLIRAIERAHGIEEAK